MLIRSLRFLVRWRVLFLALWILAIAGAASLLPGLRFEFSLHPLLKGNDGQVSSVREFYETFPPAEGHAVIAATFENVITVAQLRQAAAWAAELEDLPEVMEVYSPAMLLDLKFQGFTLDEWARLGGTGREPIELGNGPGMNTIRGRYLSHDLHSLALHVRRAKRVPQADFDEALRRVTAQWEHPVRLLGIEMVLTDMASKLRHDLTQLLAFQAVALIVILPLFFRSFRMAYLPLLTAATGLLVYLGILSAVDQKLGLIYLASPLLIVVIGLSDSIHLQQKFDEARADGFDVPASLAAMLRSVGVACVLTSLTTAIGFLSLRLARHEEVRNFGLWCAIGVGVVFVVVILLMPVLLACSPGSGKPARWRARFDPSGLRRRFAIPAIALLVAISGGIAFVKVDSSISRELPPETESVRNLDWFAANFQGSDRIELDVTGALDDPDVFAAVERIQAELSRENGIAGSSSYVDLIRFTLPAEVVDTKDGPYLGMRALGELDPFPENLVTRSGDRACILFYASNQLGLENFKSFEKRFDELVREFTPKARIRLTGYVSMAYHSVNLITETLFRSFGMTFIAITIVLAIALRSVPLALLCLVPNALPILVALGVAGWIDIPLRVGIVIVFSVGLGLAVDDTIHLVMRLRQLQNDRRDASLRDHLDETLRSAGFAVILTSIVLLVAAVAFLFSDFTTMRDTGLILGVITTAALLADLAILPWLIERFASIVTSKPPRASPREP